MIRRIAITFAFFAGLSGSYAMAVPNSPISPEMQCIATCHGNGFTLESCANFCVPE